MKKTFYILLVVLLVGIFAVNANEVSANHSWSSYHWARTLNPFTLKFGDNVTPAWDSYLDTTASDWSLSSVLDITKVTGLVNPRTCKTTTGRVEVCNSKYGNNGWLGIAQIWINGDHITKGSTKLNDTYFNTRTYNTPAWRNLVMCQEVGHTLGLDHQDEDFNNPNLGTCMDYANDPSTNQHPNAHDYEQLELIYQHLDSTTTASQTTDSKNLGEEVSDLRSSWGKAIRQDKMSRDSVFEKDLGMGNKVLTHVFWVE